jgi:parvulin-like peptidyl-prolyl isomerase
VIPRTIGRLVALVLASVAIAAVAGGCSSTLRDAATVTYDDDGTDKTVHIRREDFEEDVRDLSESDQIMESVAQQGVEETPGGTADARLSALWLTTLINSIAIDAEFSARGLKVTDEQREQVAASFTAIDDLPQHLVDTLIDQQARATAVAEDVGTAVPDAVEPTDEQLRQLYEQNQEAIAGCASGKEVAHVLVADEATANEIAAQLADGAAFADVAAAQSTDTGSAQQGGSLGCLGAQPFVDPFQQAADAAPLDEVVGPIQSEFGYHLILVTAWNPSFEKFRDQLAEQAASQTQQQVQQQREQLYNDAINARIEAMDVTVDPRFGTWEATNGQFQVVAPTTPEPRNQREPSTTTTPTSVPVPGG